MSLLRSPPGSGLNAGRSGSQPNLSVEALTEFSGLSQITLRNKRKKTDDEDFIKTELAEIRKDMSQMMIMLTTLTTNQNEFMKKITEDMSTIKQQVREVKSVTDTLTTEQDAIKSYVTELVEKGKQSEKRIELLEANLKNQTEASSRNLDSQEDIMSEINERQLRRKNVIVFGIPESSKSDSEDQYGDKQEVHKILKTIDANYPEPEKVFRIGKYVAEKNRPLKVCFRTEDVAQNILRQKVKAKLDVKIYSDQTPKQISYLKNLKDKLKSRNENGEKNLGIKFIKGTPKIVHVTPKN